MSDKRVILFDLDGTITDTKPGITKSAQYALRHFGIHVEDLNSLECMIGPPLEHSFRDLYGFSPEKAWEAVQKYREYYAVDGIFDNAIYNGIPELLAELSGRGKIVGLATSKPEVFARRILEHFSLARHFDYIAGAEIDGTRVEKPDVLRYALESLGNPALESVVMVGDRKYDITGAREIGVSSIGVLYGFGERREIQLAAPDKIAATVEELREILL